MAGQYQHLYGRSNAAHTIGVVPNPNRRVKIADDVFLPDNIWNTRTGRVVPQAQPQTVRTYAQATSIGYRESFQKEARDRGVRSCSMDMKKALIMAMALFVVLGMFTLINRSALLDAGDRLEIARRGVTQLMEENNDLRQQIEEAKQEADIGYKAANELGMIRASDAQTIALVAMDAYPEYTTQTGYTAEVVMEGWGETAAPQLQLTANLE